MNATSTASVADPAGTFPCRKALSRMTDWDKVRAVASAAGLIDEVTVKELKDEYDLGFAPRHATTTTATIPDEWVERLRVAVNTPGLLTPRLSNSMPTDRHTESGPLCRWYEPLTAWQVRAVEIALAAVADDIRAQALRDAATAIKTHNDAPVTAENLRFAATHGALTTSWVFDVLQGLADAIDRAEEVGK